MCGIFGIVRRTYDIGASKTHNEKMKTLFENLFLQSQVRGTDSSGMFLVNKKRISAPSTYTKSVKKLESAPEAFVNKAPISVEKYIKSKEYKNVIDRINDWTVSLVGHTRMATQGLPEDNRNNHPFVCGDIVGVHNGVIHNWRQVAKTFDLKLRGNCDSEVIFALINQFMEKRQASLQEAVSATSRHVKGGMACAVMDISDLKSLVLFRRGRPLHLRLNSVSPESLMFSSESSILKNAFFKTTTKTKGLNIFNWKETTLDDYSGVILNTNLNPSQWVEEAPLFKLS